MSRKLFGLAGLAFAWGFGKNLAVGRRVRAGVCEGDCELFYQQALAPNSLLAVSVVAPVFEEITYRARLYGALRQTTGSALVGGLASSAIFGLAHMRPPTMPDGGLRNVPRVFDAFLGGLLFTIVYEAGGLAPAIGCHALHNLGASLGFAAGVKKP